MILNKVGWMEYVNVVISWIVVWLVASLVAWVVGNMGENNLLLKDVFMAQIEFLIKLGRNLI